jgi:hypothetical protein
MYLFLLLFKIINEFELTSLIENKLKLISHIDSKYLNLPEKKSLKHRKKRRRNTYANVIELPYMFKQNIRRQSGHYLEVDKGYSTYLLFQVTT